MNIPDDLKYSEKHEWVKVEGNVATIGITDYAQEQLGDIVYVELPKIGEEIGKDDAFGVLESVKAVSDCFSPVGGKIVDINSVLNDTPEAVNEDPYEEGWIIKIEMGDKSEASGLMDFEQYKKFVKEESA